MSWGVPLFIAKPDLDKQGRWRPTGGHGSTGFWFPQCWQESRPDQSVVDRWRPGDALCAVTGHVLDLLDLDPRNGGDATFAELARNGLWPEVYCSAATPSGGRHDFVAPLGVRSRDGVRPGLDVKAGAGGGGHGIAFLAPTVKLSKSTGQLSQYAWVIPPRRRPEQDDDSGAAIAALVSEGRTRAGGPRAPNCPRSAESLPPRLDNDNDTDDDADADSVVAAFLARVPGGPPCGWMRDAANAASKVLTGDQLHRGIMGPVLRMVRGAASGHQGLDAALAELRKDFVSRAQIRGGVRELASVQEWDRALAGAVAKVPHQGTGVRPTAACDCWLEQYLRDYDQAPPHLHTLNGRQRATDRVVIDCLLSSARRGRSRRIQVSQRQIAEAADVSLANVSQSLKRLREQGWVERTSVAGYPDRLDLLVPQAAVTRTTEKPTAAGSSVVLVTARGVHQVLGPAGAGPGAAATFARLPEWRRRVRGRSGHLVRVTPGTAASGARPADPVQGPRAIPHPPTGRGKTVAQLAQEMNVPTSTVRGRLNKLHRLGLAFRDGQRRWWRYRFDPEWLADREGIPDTAEARRRLHVRQRRLYYVPLIKAGSVRPVVDDDGSVRYLERLEGEDTGSILWIDREPDAARWIASLDPDQHPS